MSEPKTSILNKAGLSLTWAVIWRLVTWLVPVIGVIVMLYLSSVFVTHAQMAETVKPYQTLPGRIEKLEDFKLEQKSTQQSTTAAVQAMQTDLAGVKAQLQSLKEESSKNTDRILQRLDSMRH